MLPTTNLGDHGVNVAALDDDRDGLTGLSEVRREDLRRLQADLERTGDAVRRRSGAGHGKRLEGREGSRREVDVLRLDAELVLAARRIAAQRLTARTGDLERREAACVRAWSRAPAHPLR